MVRDQRLYLLLWVVLGLGGGALFFPISTITPFFLCLAVVVGILVAEPESLYPHLSIKQVSFYLVLLLVCLALFVMFSVGALSFALGMNLTFIVVLSYVFSRLSLQGLRSSQKQDEEDYEQITQSPPVKKIFPLDIIFLVLSALFLCLVSENLVTGLSRCFAFILAVVMLFCVLTLSPAVFLRVCGVGLLALAVALSQGYDRIILLMSAGLWGIGLFSVTLLARVFYLSMISLFFMMTPLIRYIHSYYPVEGAVFLGKDLLVRWNDNIMHILSHISSGDVPILLGDYGLFWGVLAFGGVVGIALLGLLFWRLAIAVRRMSEETQKIYFPVFFLLYALSYQGFSLQSPKTALFYAFPLLSVYLYLQLRNAQPFARQVVDDIFKKEMKAAFQQVDASPLPKKTERGD